MPWLHDSLRKLRALADGPTLGNLHPDGRAQAIARAGLDGKSFGAIQAPHFGIIDPDYARVFTQARIVAWQYGYACVMHGSFTRDLDLLLTPWEDRATANHEQLLKLIADACGLHFRDGVRPVWKAKPDFTDKPHGRKSCSLFFPEAADRRWVDISMTPCVPKGSAAGNAEYDSWTLGVKVCGCLSVANCHSPGTAQCGNVAHGVLGTPAHSKSEYKRRVAQGDPSVLPPSGVPAVVPTDEGVRFLMIKTCESLPENQVVKTAFMGPLQEFCLAFARAVLAAPPGVEGRCHQTFCAQTPIPSPMDYEGEG